MNQNDKNYYMNIHNTDGPFNKNDDTKITKIKSTDSNRDLLIKVLEKSIQNNNYTIYKSNIYSVYDVKQWREDKQKLRTRIDSGVLTDF